MKILGQLLMVGVLGASLSGASLDLEKKSYKGGEDIQVSFIASGSFPKDAWVGIVPSSVPHGKEAVNDQNNLAYQYLNQQKMGMLTFKAPVEEGKYDLRMNDTDSNGKEVASVTFKVVAKTPVSAVSASNETPTGDYLRLDKFSFEKGADIKVTFGTTSSLQKNGWIGVIPSNIPHGSEEVNDQNDLSYQYMNKKNSGELIFKAPLKEGNYDLRMNDTDSNGKEIANISFTVL